jgi:hypothetical protein
MTQVVARLHQKRSLIANCGSIWEALPFCGVSVFQEEVQKNGE